MTSRVTKHRPAEASTQYSHAIACPYIETRFEGRVRIRKYINIPGNDEEFRQSLKRDRDNPPKNALLDQTHLLVSGALQGSELAGMAHSARLAGGSEDRGHRRLVLHRT